MIQHYTIKGNFRRSVHSFAPNHICAIINFLGRAARQNDDLAELYENEIGDTKRAMEAYATSGEWYEGDNAEASVNRWLLTITLRHIDLINVLGLQIRPT